MPKITIILLAIKTDLCYNKLSKMFCVEAGKMKLSVDKISAYVYQISNFRSCSFTPNNEAPKTTCVYRLMFMSEGSCELELDGEIQRFERYDLLFLEPGKKYQILNTFGEFEVINFFFDFIPSCRNERYCKTHLLWSEYSPEFCSERYEFTDTNTFSRSRLHKNMFRLSDRISELRSASLSFTSLRQAYMNVIMTRLLLDFISIYEFEADCTNTAAIEIANYINANCELPLTAEELGKRYGYHPNHISRMIRQLTKMPLHEYVIHQKIRRAAILLSETDLTVSEIAQHLGFADSSHFSRTFKRITGVTPSGYRRI